MNEINRSAIIVLAALAIIVMAVVIFIAWAAPDETIDRLGDFVQYLDAHNDNPSRLILTLGALTLIVLAGLAIVVEVAPQEQRGELRVEQEGTTTVISREGLCQRLEEALLALPSVTAAKVDVASRSNGVATSLDLTLAPGSNVAHASQEARRIITQSLQEEMGLPVADPPRIRVAIGSAPAVQTASAEPPASQPEGPEPRADAESR